MINNDIDVLSQMTNMDHEEVLFCQDKATGLKAIIAVHSTVLGPSLGGTRMWSYANEAEALNDVLRLSRGMSYKAAVAGLNLGGGKAVIIGDARTEKTEFSMRRFGKFVDSLGGRYITAEDVGMTTKDMEYISMETKYVAGLPKYMGGSGDPSPVTAYGVYMGMKAAAKTKWGSDSLTGKKVAVQGIGHVGEYLVGHLVKEGALVTISDIFQDRIDEVCRKYNVQGVFGDEIYDVDMDIYAPCALGATLNDDTLKRLKCEIVAGAANNQLKDEKIHMSQLDQKGIIYAPDFVINSGGIINIFPELSGMYNEERALAQTEKVYDVTMEVFNRAKKDGISTAEAAVIIAEERIAKVGKLNQTM